MYLINKSENSITELEEQTFSDLGFREREHLQEWIAKNPQCLGEDLLIIQKEFSGFSETKERLDLLALDKSGNLVLIENKLDDSGKDVTWQSIKYASYCSSLTTSQVIEIYQSYLGTRESAVENISEFLGIEGDEFLLNEGGTSQRIILIAAKFRKEVTSSVLWLMNFNINISCFTVSPFQLGDQIFLNIEQILPTKEVKEFSISMASKAKEETQLKQGMQNRHYVRMKFWKNFLETSNADNTLFSTHSPSKDAWIGKGMGVSGINLNLVISRLYCRAEIYINRGKKEENKRVFELLFSQKEKIEEELGFSLEWEKMENKVTSRIKKEFSGVNYFNTEEWEEINLFLIRNSVKMEKVFKQYMNF